MVDNGEVRDGNGLSPVQLIGKKRAHDSSDSSTSKRVHSDGDSGILSIKVLIPSAAVGAVIGKGGEVMRNMRSDFHCYVQLSKDVETYPGTNERICLVKGHYQNIAKVIEVILKKIHEKCDATTKADAFDHKGMIRGDEVKLVVPNSSVGLIVGKSGTNIKEIRTVFGCQIQTHPKVGSPETQTSTENVVTLGHQNHLQLILATTRVLEKVAADPNHASEISKEDGGKLAAFKLLSFLENFQIMLRSSGMNETSVFEIMSAMQALAKYNIIGLGLGVGLAALPRLRSAEPISLLPCSTVNDTSATKTDSQSTQLDQPMVVNPVLVEVLRTGCSTGESGENFASSVIVERSVTDDSMELEIPEADVGAVLGPKARILQEINFYSGCKIQVNRRDTKSDLPAGTRLISLSGDQKSMHICRMMIERLVNDSHYRRVGARN